MVTQNFFKEKELIEQKTYQGDIVFPVVLSPYNTNVTEEENMCLLQEAIKAEKPWLESLLNKNGAILFRGFPVTTPSDFNDMVEAFGFPELSYLGGRAPRTQVVGRVYTANESPPEKRIHFHHEMCAMPRYPSKVFFFCEEEPGSGGETPILMSNIIYEKMKEKHPEFVSQLEDHGMLYVKAMDDEVRESSIGGRSWKATFMTEDKNVAEERAAELESRLEWTENNGVKMIVGPLPAFGFHKESQRKTWFNHMVFSYNSLNHGKDNTPDTYALLGNGDPVPTDIREDCLKIMEEESVTIPWKKGDVILINNLMVLHARNALLKPPRSILASLCK